MVYSSFPEVSKSLLYGFHRFRAIHISTPEVVIILCTTLALSKAWRYRLLLYLQERSIPAI